MMDMLAFLFAVILLLIALLAITLRKTYYYLPPKELKRQAEAGDELARTLYRAVAYGASLRALLWIIIVFASAGGLLLLGNIAPPLLGLILIATLLWLAFSWLPNTRVTSVGARLAAWATPPIASLLGYIHPVLAQLAEPLQHHYRAMEHTGLYEASDLLELLERQQAQGDNRVSGQQLDAAKRVLSAHQYHVRDVLLGRDAVKSVSDNDTVGLVLLDELHASKQTSFPVRRGTTDKIIGTLYLHDLNLKTEGKVRDYMHSDVRYLHEDDSLQQALQAFYKTKHQLFVVVNSFEEYVGVITLERVMQQLTGDMPADGFDQHHDLAAVAGKHAHDNDPPEPEPEPAPSQEESQPESPAAADPDFEEVAELDTPAAEPEPQTELVTDENEAPEESEMSEAEDTPGEPVPEENTEEANPEDLAALDLPDEETEAETDEGKTIKFATKPETPSGKTPPKK